MTDAALTPEPLACALFLTMALSTAGILHAAWLRSAYSRRFAGPIDFGKTFHGRRILGDNKMWRGLMVMPLAAACTFAGLAYFREALPEWLVRGMWPLPTASFALLGFISGLAFMLAELPNSFFKRRLGVVPGTAPAAGPLAALCFILDRTDSVLGVLLVLALWVPLAPMTWAWALLFGAAMHGLYSVLLHRLGVKARPL